MKIIVGILFQLISLSLLAQTLSRGNREFSFSIGGVEAYMEKFPTTVDINFLNYFDTFPEHIDYEVVSLRYKFDFFSRMSADIKLMVMSDLVPDNFDISAYYHFNNAVSIGMGSYLVKFYITHFEQFQLQSLPDYYLVDYNSQQLKVYDLGFYLTPMFKLIESDRFQATVKFNIGVSSFSNEKSVFYHKRKFSNERIIYRYNTKMTFQPYINPKLEVRLRAFDINNTSVGLLLNSHFYYSKRSMNYNRTIQKWTPDNEITEFVRTPKHLYNRLGADIGFYIKW